MTANQIAYWNLKETERSNRVREGETERSNKARESETFRSNLAKETETNRSNRARENETVRSNLEQEALKRDIQSAQKTRWAFQNATDVLKAVGNVAPVFTGLVK